ncbi:MAG: VOC family protein [Hyphomonadaceae bacterium]|nr:VOC family protein [Hyphomonadaceae bacterium]
MLGDAPMQANLGIANPERAKQFYGGVLGLAVSSEDPLAVVVGNAHGQIRLAVVPVVMPAPYAVLSFAVPDIGAVAASLSERGVAAQRFPFLQADVRGVWTAPDGTQVLWIRDPDQNLIGIVQPA